MIFGFHGRLLNEIKSMYVDDKACERLSRVESEWYKSSDVRQRCAVSMAI